MNLVDRAKNIVLDPKNEWETIATEETTTAELYQKYIIPLAAITPIASFIGLSLIGVSAPLIGTVRIPILSGLSQAVLSFALSLAGVFILSLIIDALAPTFGGEKNPAHALKAATYSYTPAWLAGALMILPSLGILILFASFYSLYLLSLGLPVLMKSSREKSLHYTAIVVVCAVVLSMIFGALSGAVSGFGHGMAGRPQMGAATTTESTGNPALDQLQKMGAQMEAANKKMEAAQQSGNPKAQMAAAGEVMAALVTGGEQVQPVDHTLLKNMLPGDVAGLKRGEASSESSVIAGIKAAKAQADYSDEQGSTINVSITDMGSTKGLGMLASWAATELNRTTDSGYEKVYRSGSDMAHEEYDRENRQGSYTMLIANRFLMEANGSGVEMKTIKELLARINLAKLHAMQNHGVQKNE